MTARRCLVLAVFALGCGATASATPPVTSPVAQPVNGTGTTDGSAPGGPADDADVRALVTEVLAPQLCPRLLGSFIGLPGGDDTAHGPAAGTVPSAGRWWIRTCNARVVGNRLELSMGGMGWTWVDREAQGFRVRQYLLFEADAALGADVAVGYDRAQRVASLWLTPAAGVTAHVTPRGVVSAEPTGFFSRVLGGVASVAGTSIDDRARAQAADLGSSQLRDRLGVGFTLTYALATRQMDFMVGALRRGEVPVRPYPSDTPSPWLINQRSTVWPGGLDVVGPLDPGAPAGLDVELEDGDGASLRAVCSEPLARYFDSRFRDPAAGPAPPAGVTVIDLAPSQGPRHVTLPAPPCPTLLVIAPRPGATRPVRLRYRVAPESLGAGAPVGSVGSVVPSPRRVRIQVAGVAIHPLNPDGRSWDVVGGQADPFVVTASIPLHREIDRTPTVQDHNTATWDRWLPGAFELTRDLPLRFTVYDEDTTTNELVGTADLDAAALPLASNSTEVTLPLRTTGAVPVETGTLRLRVTALP